MGHHRSRTRRHRSTAGPRVDPAVDASAAPREADEAALAELTGLLPATVLGTYPEGTRIIVRRERPHPGAHLRIEPSMCLWHGSSFSRCLYSF